MHTPEIAIFCQTRQDIAHNQYRSQLHVDIRYSHHDLPQPDTSRPGLPHQIPACNLRERKAGCPDQGNTRVFEQCDNVAVRNSSTHPANEERQ